MSWWKKKKKKKEKEKEKEKGLNSSFPLWQVKLHHQLRGVQERLDNKGNNNGDVCGVVADEFDWDLGKLSKVQ